jgi:methionyl-tRNA formyltransferase
MGTPQAAAVSLERLLADGYEIAAVYTQPDRPSGRGNKITFSPVKQLALDRGLAVLQPTKIRTPEAIDEFRSFNADIAVVVAYGRILPESFLTAFPQGAINVHFSMLPRYRGAAPVNWAIVKGEKTTGVTTMKMDAGLDTGDILLQRETDIGQDETAVELMGRLSLLGAGLLSETLNNLSSLTAIKQDDSHATLAPIMTKEDGRIDWSASALKIARMVRGFQPFPTTHTMLDGKKLTIWKAVGQADATEAKAGSVILAKGDEIIVKCGEDTALKIVELQLEGKRRLPARDVLNGGAIVVGSQLG